MESRAVREKAAALVCEVRRPRIGMLLTALARLGIACAEWQHGRIVQLFESRPPRWLPITRPAQLLESGIEIFRIVVPFSQALTVAADLLANGLAMDGSGAALRIEEFELIHDGPPLTAADPVIGTPVIGTELPGGMIPGLTGVAIVVPRGQGNNVARVALDHGLCVPLVTFGLGSGIRDRLGLLRITIPPEKELISLIVPDEDAEVIVGMLATLLRIDSPGRGFVYGHPVHSAMLNLWMRVGNQTHAATVEQIIDAIDHLHGGTGWRRRFGEVRLATPGYFLRGLDRLDMVCAEEQAQHFQNVAMDAGAGGVTTSQSQTISVKSEEKKAAQPIARSAIVLPHDNVSGVVDALTSAGFFDTGGHIEQVHCPFVLSSRK